MRVSAKERLGVRQGRTPAALFLAGAAAAGMLGVAYLGVAYPNYFKPYFGSVPPLTAFAFVTVLGIISVSFLDRQGAFAIVSREPFKSLRGVALAACVFAALAISVDTFVFRFPRDLNVPPPQSLIFYPAMGLVVEVCFHALPLAALVRLFALLKIKQGDHLVWIGIVLASLVEPLVQVGPELTESDPSLRTGFVGVHVFAFNVVEFHLFRRHGFVSMFAFRLAYYLCWHILWGQLRLMLLF